MVGFRVDRRALHSCCCYSESQEFVFMEVLSGTPRLRIVSNQLVLRSGLFDDKKA